MGINSQFLTSITTIIVLHITLIKGGNYAYLES